MAVGRIKDKTRFTTRKTIVKGGKKKEQRLWRCKPTRRKREADVCKKETDTSEKAVNFDKEEGCSRDARDEIVEKDAVRGSNGDDTGQVGKKINSEHWDGDGKPQGRGPLDGRYDTVRKRVSTTARENKFSQVPMQLRLLSLREGQRRILTLQFPNLRRYWYKNIPTSATCPIADSHVY